MKHIRKSLETLFPLLSKNGVYLVEDLHTAYWPPYAGGYHSSKNLFRYTLQLIHDMHHWYHGKAKIHPEISSYCDGIHVHDSLLIIEKGEGHKPVYSRIG
ncbi:hypothetical protein F2Q65_14115 [Thiohalocapsa marina]|uniref:Class I SAM-dependent methyltransferase n=1 Tax=Thiohalocapsa marina TaxID=424902 RepID=A0A5M8FGF0_9GAMM|nr:hypothetical protein [Thiohalocapsa marina]KAA6183938.1 hypothetical protein F2Q65_14115 [Thiohalocapsa marina]